MCVGNADQLKMDMGCSMFLGLKWLEVVMKPDADATCASAVDGTSLGVDNADVQQF